MATGPLPPRTTEPLTTYPYGTAPASSEGNKLPFGGIAFLDEGEALLFSVFNFATGVTLRVNIRIVNKAGILTHHTEQYVLTNTDGTAVNKRIKCGGGYIQSLRVLAIAGTPGPTDTYCEVGVVYGDAVDRNIVEAVLLAGYVTATQSLYPVPLPVNPNLTGQGVLVKWGTFSGSMVGGIATTLQDGIRVYVRQASITVQTSAAGGNRFLVLSADNGSGSTLAGCIRVCKTPQPPSTTYTYILCDAQEDTALVARTGNYVNMNIGTFIVKENLAATQRLVVSLDGGGTDSVVSPGGDVLYEYWIP